MKIKFTFHTVLKTCLLVDYDGLKGSFMAAYSAQVKESILLFQIAVFVSKGSISFFQIAVIKLQDGLA